MGVRERPRAAVVVDTGRPAECGPGPGPERQDLCVEWQQSPDVALGTGGPGAAWVSGRSSPGPIFGGLRVQPWDPRCAVLAWRAPGGGRSLWCFYVYFCFYFVLRFWSGSPWVNTT